MLSVSPFLSSLTFRIWKHCFIVSCSYKVRRPCRLSVDLSLSPYNFLLFLPARLSLNSLYIFLYYKMPKEGKTFTTSSRRSVPYSVATIKAIAPSSTMATHGATSPQPAGTDRHASQSWPPEKDEILMRVRQQGLNWLPISTQYFPDKTPNACRKRHERLMEKRNNTDNWDGVKIETLARAYINVRESMWKLLADQVGEKWQTVEAKVCIYPSAYLNLCQG